MKHSLFHGYGVGVCVWELGRGNSVRLFVSLKISYNFDFDVLRFLYFILTNTCNARVPDLNECEFI